MAHERLLGEFQARYEPLHLGVGLVLRARELRLHVASLASQRDADHRENGPRIFFPTRRRELGLADRAIAVEIEEAHERTLRRSVGDRADRRALLHEHLA